MLGYEFKPRTAKRTTEDCIALKLPQLKSLGMLQRGNMSRRSIACYDGSRNFAGRLTIVSDIECLEISPCILIEGFAFGWAIEQCISLESLRMRFGGERWCARCPKTRKRCTTLVLPPGERQFASMAGWQVIYASQRLDRLRRKCHALDKAEERLERLSKYTRKPTRRRLEDKVRYLCDALGTESVLD